jgi:hypothetical protein
VVSAEDPPRSLISVFLDYSIKQLECMKGNITGMSVYVSELLSGSEFHTHGSH